MLSGSVCLRASQWLPVPELLAPGVSLSTQPVPYLTCGLQAKVPSRGGTPCTLLPFAVLDPLSPLGRLINTFVCPIVMMSRPETQLLRAPLGPLCRRSNQCAPARSGSFGTPCWCTDLRESLHEPVKNQIFHRAHMNRFNTP